MWQLQLPRSALDQLFFIAGVKLPIRIGLNWSTAVQIELEVIINQILSLTEGVTRLDKEIAEQGSEIDGSSEVMRWRQIYLKILLREKYYHVPQNTAIVLSVKEKPKFKILTRA